jgi:hypothetical protein
LLETLEQLFILIVKRRPTRTVINDPVVDCFDQIVLEVNASTIFRVVRGTPVDRPVQRLAEWHKEMLLKKPETQAQTVAALALFREDGVPCL